MKTLMLNGKSFQLEANVYKFLSDYIERINSFVKKNGIEPELHQDILERLADKLAEKENGKGGITQKIAIHIVNDLGEAEEIFSEDMDIEEGKEEKKSEFSNNNLLFYEKLQKNDWNRPQEKAWLLGVCAMFAQASQIPLWLWRGAVIFLTWVFCMSGFIEPLFLGSMAYLFLALLFPRKEKDYHKKSIIGYFLTQIRDLRLAIGNGIRTFFRLIKWILGTALPKLIQGLQKLFGPLRNLAKIIFLSLWNLGLIFILILAGIALYYLFHGYVQHNVEFTAFLPAILKWGVALGILSAFLLLLGGIGALFKKKLSNTTSLITGIGSGILAIIIGSISAIEIISGLGTEGYETQKELIIPINTADKIDINLENINEQFYEHFGIVDEAVSQREVVNFIPYEGKDIKVMYNYTFRPWPQNKRNLNLALENLSDPQYTKKGNSLDIFLKDHQIFDQITPYLPLRFDVDLYIPQDLKFNFSFGKHKDHFSSNLSRPSWARNHGYHGIGTCSDWISYDKENNSFFCPMDITAMGNHYIRGIIGADIRNKADMVVPLQGFNKSRSHHGEMNDTYRLLHSINWYDNSHFIAKFSDKFFNLFIEMNVDMDNEGNVIIKDKKLIQVEQKGEINQERMKYYKGREQLKDFDIKLEETKHTNNNDEYISKKEFNTLIEALKRQGYVEVDN